MWFIFNVRPNGCAVPSLLNTQSQTKADQIITSLYAQLTSKTRRRKTELSWAFLVYSPKVTSQVNYPLPQRNSKRSFVRGWDYLQLQGDLNGYSLHFGNNRGWEKVFHSKREISFPKGITRKLNTFSQSHSRKCIQGNNLQLCCQVGKQQKKKTTEKVTKQSREILEDELVGNGISMIGEPRKLIKKKTEKKSISDLLMDPILAVNSLRGDIKSHSIWVLTLRIAPDTQQALQTCRLCQEKIQRALLMI